MSITTSVPSAWELSSDRFFDPEPGQRALARLLYQEVADAPIISPHGHVDPRMFSDEDASLGSPADLFIIPDHYVFRMLYSQGIPLEKLGIPRQDDGGAEHDHRAIWQLFIENFHLFRGTPTGIWLADELQTVFNIHAKPNGKNAQAIYDQITAQLNQPEFKPRALYERFKIQTLCTTDPAWDRLEHHQAIRVSGWDGDIRPTFRPDAVIDLSQTNWRENLTKLAESSQMQIDRYDDFILALETQRAHFKAMGATASDHAALTPYTGRIDSAEAETIFQRALKEETQTGDAERFTGHMLMEMARMSIEDGLVMQLHPGSLRNYNRPLYLRFGADKGADIPLATEYTRNLQPLLNAYGDHPDFNLILFTLDESAYSREMAPLAGHYPSVKLGPPWWFHDSLNGMRRYFDRVIETAGIYNTTGFNDDTRAFLSIPARHDVWRRVSANWLAGLVVRGVVDEEEAAEMIHLLAYGLAQKAYHL